jgi:rhodanese-related sulfurtransferase
MAMSLKEMMAAARGAVPEATPEEVKELLNSGSALAVDVREQEEFRTRGRMMGAVNAPRGHLEFKVDPDSPRYDSALQKDGTILVYCNSGARAALAGKTMKDMGYTDVRFFGINDWVASGGAIEE